MISPAASVTIALLGLAACGAPTSTGAPPTSQPVAPVAPVAPELGAEPGSDHWLELPGVGRRIACPDGKVLLAVDVQDRPLVTFSCGDAVLSVGVLPVASLAGAIAELEASLGFLYSVEDHREETATSFRLVHHNEGGDGTNYWVETVRVLDGEHYLCQASSMAMDGEASAEKAAAGATICATLE